MPNYIQRLVSEILYPKVPWQQILRQLLV
ncbi:MAG: hypothetical protein LBR06_06665 [Bacteroidales bacterium]|nr:hypothetical protein [Bacteroidales bacterium]